MSAHSDLINIAEKAIAEFRAWDARNEARSACKKWRFEAGFEKGEEVSSETADEDALAEYNELAKHAERMQRKLNARRATTRQAIIRACRATGA